MINHNTTIQKCVFLLVPALERVSLTVWSDVCAEFDTRRKFSVHFILCSLKNLLLGGRPTSAVMRKLEAFSEHTLTLHQSRRYVQ